MNAENETGSSPLPDEGLRAAEPKFARTDYCRFYDVPGSSPYCQTHAGRWVRGRGYCDASPEAAAHPADDEGLDPTDQAWKSLAEAAEADNARLRAEGLDVERLRREIEAELELAPRRKRPQFDAGAVAAYHFVLSLLPPLAATPSSPSPETAQETP